MNDLVSFAGIFFAGVAGGAINSVAGGGGLIAFASLVAFGQPEIISNANGPTALGAGSLSSALGYRKEGRIQLGLLLTLAAPSLIGSLLGAMILVITPPETFRLAVPFLILFSTMLLASRHIIGRRFGINPTNDEHVKIVGRLWGTGFQLVVSMWGGFFGAGMGILMLGSFSLIGMRDIHRMNAIKTVLGAIISGTAFVFFAFKGLVVWPLALLMAVGSIIGGYGGARLAQRVNPHFLQSCVVAIGLLVSGWFFIRTLLN